MGFVLIGHIGKLVWKASSLHSRGGLFVCKLIEFMTLYQFIFFIGIMQIVFNFGWNYIFVPSASLFFHFIKFPDTYGTRLLKLSGSYILVSLIGWVTLSALTNNHNLRQILLYVGIGVLILFITYGSNYYEVRKKAQEEMDLDLIRKTEKESLFNFILIIVVIVFYIFILFNFSVSSNFLIIGIYNGIGWIYSLPIIGTIIGIFGVIYVVSLIIKCTYFLMGIPLIISDLYHKKSTTS